jgi:hypothetical protein
MMHVGQIPIFSYVHDFAGASVNALAPTEIISALAHDVTEIHYCNGCGRDLVLCIGAVNEEQIVAYLPNNWNCASFSMLIPKGTRVSISTTGGTISSGTDFSINGYG